MGSDCHGWSDRPGGTEQPPLTDGGPTVGAVLLAAGLGTRFEDGNKLLADLDGRPVVYRAAERVAASSVAETVAVLGHQATAVRAALDGLGLLFRVNEDYREGQSTSVAVGVEAARDRGWDAAVFALGDMPSVATETIERLVSAYADGAGTVLAPGYEGHRGNPVLFDSAHFDALADVTGDRGGRDIIDSRGRLVPVDDPGVRRDVDRTRDLDEHR
jgi:molybdenum cofactor cytidylyltransferase